MTHTYVIFTHISHKIYNHHTHDPEYNLSSQHQCLLILWYYCTIQQSHKKIFCSFLQLIAWQGINATKISTAYLHKTVTGMCWEAPTYRTVHCNAGSYPKGKLLHFKVHPPFFELQMPLHPGIISNWGNTCFCRERLEKITKSVFKNSDQHESQSL